ncbi:hypothetical protein C6W92_14315 [Roseovarius sp. A46]|nr:hypothetical protein C6W92_14315 [Roseovarius sp. A46]
MPFFNSPRVHFYRNVFSLVPSGKVRDVSKMLKAIHAQEDHLEDSCPPLSAPWPGRAARTACCTGNGWPGDS